MSPQRSQRVEMIESVAMNRTLNPRLVLPLLMAAMIVPEVASAQDEGMPPRSLEVTAEPGFEEGSEPGFGAESAPPQTKGEGGFEALSSKGQLHVEKKAAAIKKAHGLTIKTPARSAAATGQFSKRAREGDVEMVAVTPERGLELYRNNTSAIRDKHVEPLTVAEREALGVDTIAQPVQLVRDGTTQFMVWRKDKDRRGDVVYKVTVYKIMGNYLGEVLDREIGRLDKASNKPVRTARVEVLASGNDIKLKLVPVRNGADRLSAVSVLEWDTWEGVFVAPRIAPTSPVRGRNLNF